MPANQIAAKILSKHDGFAIFGLGYNYALSLEAALKTRETSEFFAGSRFKYLPETILLDADVLK